MRSGRISLSRFQRGQGPATPSLQTSSLQNQETIKCGWLRHPVCGSLLQKQILIQKDLQESAFFPKKGVLSFHHHSQKDSKCKKTSEQVFLALSLVIPFTPVTNLNLKGTVFHICTTIHTSLELQNFMLKSPLTHPILHGGHI